MEMKDNHTKWVACWGTATSISDRKECVYAKDITLRYPIPMCFDGSALRLRFSNLTGTEPVAITRVVIALEREGERTVADTVLCFHGVEQLLMQPGQEVESDAAMLDVKSGDILQVSIYLGECTQMNAGTLVTGPLSGGSYTYGDYAATAQLPAELTRATNWYYFLNTVDILTSEDKHALVCYGDSITAQSWPDYLAIRAREEGFGNVSVIRRAVCGTRILRQYSCIAYQAYGLKGETRFPIELNTAGADAVIIQHGINDIIHPVGVEVNPFRPWSDMPTLQDLCDGTLDLYVNHAHKLGLKAYAGTLLPIKGWRTYNDMRDQLRTAFNNWMRGCDAFDGVVDFDAAVRDSRDPLSFAPGFDSGDHLHPSEEAYKAMAAAVPESLLNLN